MSDEIKKAWEQALDHEFKQISDMNKMVYDELTHGMEIEYVERKDSHRTDLKKNSNKHNKKFSKRIRLGK